MKLNLDIHFIYKQIYIYIYKINKEIKLYTYI